MHGRSTATAVLFYIRSKSRLATAKLYNDRSKSSHSRPAADYLLARGNSQRKQCRDKSYK